jgi:hypothetical protein
MEQLRESWMDFIDFWNWDFRIDKHWSYELGISKDQSIRSTKQYLNRLRYVKGFKFGAIVFVPLNRDGLPHAHIVMIKDPSEKKNRGMSADLLKSISLRYCTSCSVTDVVNNIQAIYLLKEKNLNLYNPQRLEWYFYRNNLLKDLR